MSERDVIAAHALYYDEYGPHMHVCACGWHVPDELEEEYLDGDVKKSTEAHADHVAAALREARTVRTVEELDALPEGSVYVSDLHPDVPETKDRGVWWSAGNDPFEPSLPGRCVYRPDEDGAR